ncbi:phospholipase D/nuclease [Amylocystis lapponica]|nr:phospholipase D/nuclease [Amylocystis lapponica]
MNNNLSEDEDLARAIALSLRESQAVPKPPPPQQVDYITISDDEDERHNIHPPAAAPASVPITMPFLSERAKMEKERLARQKRLRPDLDTEPDGRRTDQANPAAYSSVASTSTASALRQTANMHADPARDSRPTFRLTDILAPRDEIAFAIISSYCINWPWMYSFFNPRTPVIVVAHDTQGHETIKEVLPNWVKTTPFLRNGMGCMHMKLFYKSRRLRVVVSTANLVEIDWRDIENSAWVQDVPARPAPVAHDPKAADFAAAMIHVLRSVNVAPALLSFLRNDHPDLPMQRLEDLRTHWDFSKVKAMLVPSIAGKHEGWPKVILAGHTALMKAVRDLGARAEKGQELVLECQGSSIGTYSTQWVNEFYCSARGESADTWLDTTKARRAKLPYPSVKILFPTLQTVRNSALGEPGGGTMFCRRNQWAAAKFPRELFHQSKSKRGPVLMHSKMIVATFRGSSKSISVDSETEDSDAEEPGAAPLKGWVYVGSHNFTPSAWGNLSGTAFNPTLNISNYELGIVLPLRSAADADRMACWERPPRKYDLSKDEPWIQTESPAFVGLS